MLVVVGMSFGLTFGHLIWQFWWPLKWQSVKVNGALMSEAGIYRRTGSKDLMMYIPPGGGTWNGTLFASQKSKWAWFQMITAAGSSHRGVS